jgi:hypothetical protein
VGSLACDFRGLFAFPGSKHDDQIDSVSQALGDEGGYDRSLGWVS